MIAATYTPFAVNRLAAPYGSIILAAIWLSASFGVTMKVLFPRRYEWLSLGLYLAMGWLIVFVIQPLHAAMTATDFWLLMAGGIVYSRRRRLLRDRAHPLSQGDLARLRAGRRGDAFRRRRDGIRALDSATFRVWRGRRRSPRQTAMISAVLFDCDGVLVDSEVIAHAVELSVLADIGLHYDRHDFITRFMGRSDKVFYEMLDEDGRARLGRPIADEIRGPIKGRYAEEIAARLTEVEGALAAIRACRLPKAVASSSTVRGLDLKLKKVGHWDHFAPHIYSAEHVTQSKPAPDLFLHAAKALGRRAGGVPGDRGQRQRRPGRRRGRHACLGLRRRPPHDGPPDGAPHRSRRRTHRGELERSRSAVCGAVASPKKSVMPAQAGIQSRLQPSPNSRFRGNDKRGVFLQTSKPNPCPHLFHRHAIVPQALQRHGMVAPWRTFSPAHPGSAGDAHRPARAGRAAPATAAAQESPANRSLPRVTSVTP